MSKEHLYACGMLFVLSMGSLHSLGHNDQNEVQNNFQLSITAGASVGVM